MKNNNEPQSFLDRYDRAPESQKWSLVLDWLANSPFEFFKELREKRPILETPEGVLLARYDDTIEALSRPKDFTVKFYKPKMGTYLMTQDDTFQHDTEKGIMMSSFLDKLNLSKVREFIGKAGAEILEGKKGKMEIAYGYSRMVPTLMVQEIFGLNRIKAERLIRWSYWNQFDTFHNQPFHRRTDAKKIIYSRKSCGVWMALYLIMLALRKLFFIKIGFPGKDVASKILAAKYPQKDKFTLPRQVLNIGGLLIGSVETTAQAVIQALDELFNRPEMLKKAVELAKSEKTEKFDMMVWEALRFNASFKYMFRSSSGNHTIAKGTKRAITLKKGQTVFPLISSAMFDASKFKDPYTFKQNRPYGDSLHLGYGYHKCMGNAIGMEMVPEMVRQILLKKRVKPDGAVDYGNTPIPQKFRISWDR
ncbi:MAG: cytochrome P450 [Leptospirales bacterium]